MKKIYTTQFYFVFHLELAPMSTMPKYCCWILKRTFLIFIIRQYGTNLNLHISSNMCCAGFACICEIWILKWTHCVPASTTANGSVTTSPRNTKWSTEAKDVNVPLPVSVSANTAPLEASLDPPVRLLKSEVAIASLYIPQTKQTKKN